VNSPAGAIFVTVPALTLLSFIAVLCWWIAMVGLSTGAGAFFLWLPVLVTAGTVVVFAYIKPRKVTRI
jgi:hypothetical protein